MSSLRKGCKLYEKGEDMVSGDLGLGQGLKPGGFKPEDTGTGLGSDVTGLKYPFNRNPLLQCDSTCFCGPCNCIPSHCRNCGQMAVEQGMSTHSLMQSLEKETDYHNTGNFPVYADVPYGTSLRQQKQLLRQNIAHLIHHNGSLWCQSNVRADVGLNCTQEKKRNSKNKNEEIEKKLILTIQEVEELKVEFETCQLRLESKYEAIRILKKQKMAAPAT